MSREEEILMFDFDLFSDAEHKELGNDLIKYKKKVGGLLRESRMDAKGNTCYDCGKLCSSFCNSHSLPAFCLKNIAVNGDVYYSNVLVNLPILETEKGVGNAGTFQLICRECDSTIFQNYENPDNYNLSITPVMIAQIAMKNYLKNLSKRFFEKSLYDNMGRQLQLPSQWHDEKQNITELDIVEYQKGFLKAKRVSRKGWSNEYYLFFYQELNYVVPIAFQDCVTMVFDLEGNVINDIYNQSPDYHTQELHICVFPLKDSSVVFMFIDSDSKLYKNFYKQFGKLSFEDKLATINHIIFTYSEDVFMSKNLADSIINNENLIRASRKSADILSSTAEFDPLEQARDSFDLSSRNELPNLLSDKYKVR